MAQSTRGYAAADPDWPAIGLMISLTQTSGNYSQEGLSPTRKEDSREVTFLASGVRDPNIALEAQSSSIPGFRRPLVLAQL